MTRRDAYVLSYSGTRVDGTGGFGFPSLRDVAVHLGRIPRFAGATSRWWPVLLHSFVVYEILARDGHGPRVRLAGLLHDAHEALTGDVPAPFMTPTISEFQADLDGRMWRGLLGMDPPDAGEHMLVKEADTRAFKAEAEVLGPTNPHHRWPKADEDDVRVVRHFCERYSCPTDTINDRNTAPAVRDFIGYVRALIDAIKNWSRSEDVE